MFYHTYELDSDDTFLRGIFSAQPLDTLFQGAREKGRRRDRGRGIK